MKKLRISPSRLKVFLTCTWQYYCKYVLKLPDKGNEKARLGTAIHTIYECVTNTKKKHRLDLVRYSIKNKKIHPTLLRMYDWLFKKSDITSDKADELYELGQKLLLGGMTHGFGVDMKIIDTEKEFEVDLGDEVSVYGFIDKIQEVDDETLETVDYKSGVPYSPEDCEKDFQVFIYLHAVRTLFPDYKYYLFTFHFLKTKKCVTVAKSKSQIDTFIGFVKAQSGPMRNIGKENAKPTTSYKCKWCAYKDAIPASDYKGCPAYNK